MKLDAILNTISVPLEVGDLEFRLTPFPNARVAAWNRATNPDVPDDATNAQLVGLTEKVQAAQLDILADHMRDCLTAGENKKVTAKWVGNTFPQTVLHELATFFASGDKPSWVVESGN